MEYTMNILEIRNISPNGVFGKKVFVMILREYGGKSSKNSKLESVDLEIDRMWSRYGGGSVVFHGGELGINIVVIVVVVVGIDPTIIGSMTIPLAVSTFGCMLPDVVIERVGEVATEIYRWVVVGGQFLANIFKLHNMPQRHYQHPLLWLFISKNSHDSFDQLALSLKSAAKAVGFELGRHRIPGQLSSQKKTNISEKYS
ncbi:hypothetical protein Tco_0673529 [Tanacetum coccineum]